MKKKICIELVKDPLHLVKETPEQRKNRVRTQKYLGSSLMTKTKYSRKEKHKERLI